MTRNEKTTSPERLALTPEAAAIEIGQRAIVTAAQLGRRVIIGIAGGPGSGKSTLTAEVIAYLNDRIDGSAARVPMDGFHLRHDDLVAEGLTEVKGAPETFDTHAFTRFLTTIKRTSSAMEVPSYSRKLEDVVEDAFTIASNVPILVVEGNYLLLNKPAWRSVRTLLDMSIFIVVGRDKVRARLIKRRGEHGHFTDAEIRDHVDNVDMANYDAVHTTSAQADLIIDLVTDA